MLGLGFLLFVVHGAANMDRVFLPSVIRLLFFVQLWSED